MSPRTSKAADPVRITRSLCRAVDALDFAPPVAHVYNPLRYARNAHEEFLGRYAKPGIEALLLGMNPGPWGMVQTGIPFGEVALVRDWMGIEVPIKGPKHQHEKRPIEGFDCQRSEVSGRRVWSWAAERFGTADAFFERFFVWNFCPLAFLEESGRNRTPDKLPADEREPLYAACEKALVKAVEYFQPRMVIGIGKFAEDRARRTLPEGTEIGTVLHPSPASPIANRGWAPQAEKQLKALGVL